MDAAPRYLVGFAQDDLSNDWRAAQVQAVEQGLAENSDIDFIATDAKGQTARNILDVEDMLDQGIDLLILSPRNSAAMTPVVEMVYGRGIPVILLTRRIESDAYTTFIAPDDQRIALAAGQLLAQHMQGQGRVLVLQGVPTASTAIRRTEGFLEALRPYPAMQVVATLAADYKRQKAIAAIETAIDQEVAFDAIYAQSDSMAEGARLALSMLGRDPGQIPIIGIDYIRSAREAIRKGEQLASFTYPTCGAEAAEAAITLLNGGSVPRHIKVESVVVTRDNVEAVEPIF